jgi:hypothetical protein
VAANNVPGGLIDLFHGLQVAIMLALMTNILQFAWWKCKSKKLAPEADTHWLRFGPCYVLMVATVLVMIQPTCLLVIGSYGTDDTMTPCPTALDPAPEPVSTHHGMSNFFFDADDQSNALVPNTAIGLVIQILGTYLGFGFMFWGVIWSTNLHLKIAKKWNTLRNAARK